MRNQIHPPAPHSPEAFAVVQWRLLRELHEVRIGRPPQRDAAFDVFRRRLAASLAATACVPRSVSTDGPMQAGRPGSISP